MKKFILFSLFLHALPFLFLGSNANNEAQEPQHSIPEKMEIEVIPKADRIKTIGENGESQENLRYYWGLGMTSNDYKMGGYFIHEITEINTGYNAELAGLQLGDKIFLINGEKIGSENQIRGDAPKDLLLTIYRNGAIISVKTKRGKVYY